MFRLWHSGLKGSVAIKISLSTDHQRAFYLRVFAHPTASWELLKECALARWPHLGDCYYWFILILSRSDWYVYDDFICVVKEMIQCTLWWLWLGSQVCSQFKWRAVSADDRFTVLDLILQPPSVQNSVFRILFWHRGWFQSYEMDLDIWNHRSLGHLYWQ